MGSNTSRIAHQQSKCLNCFRHNALWADVRSAMGLDALSKGYRNLHQPEGRITDAALVSRMLMSSLRSALAFDRLAAFWRLLEDPSLREVSCLNDLRCNHRYCRLQPSPPAVAETPPWTSNSHVGPSARHPQSLRGDASDGHRRCGFGGSRKVARREIMMGVFLVGLGECGA